MALLWGTSFPGRSGVPESSNVSRASTAIVPAVVRPARSEALCAALAQYPRASDDALSFEKGEMSSICRPFAGANRRRLDRCGDRNADPYSSESSEPAQTSSRFSWSSRAQLAKQGKINLLLDDTYKSERDRFTSRIDEMRIASRALCCGGEGDCEREFDRIEVSLCHPNPDPDAPDSCAFGGSFRVTGETYRELFLNLKATPGESHEAQEIRRIAAANLGARALTGEAPERMGSIVLTSYVSKKNGAVGLEPVLLHEFGHACSMARMRIWAQSKPASPRSLRATEWLSGARKRCDRELELSDGYDDFWESVGESKFLSSCLKKLAHLNQKGEIDQPCRGLCPGHYLEEAVGIAFSLLSGDLAGSAASVFPNTCDHVRDGQHPMVADVVECLAQNSPRFRDRLKRSYGCG